MLRISVSKVKSYLKEHGTLDLVKKVRLRLITNSFQHIISIHGTPRSGTTWLGQIIDSSPQVRYKFQPLFSKAFKERISIRTPIEQTLRTLEEIYNREDKFLDRTKEKLAGIHKEFDQKERFPPFLAIKHNRYHYLIPYFLEFLSNIKIIGIIRHPCGTLNSWRKAPHEFLPEHDFMKNWRFAEDRTAFRPEEYFGFHKWKELTKLFLVMKAQYPENVFLLRYEDLTRNPFQKTEELYQFCQLPMNEQTQAFLTESTTNRNEDVYSVYKAGKKVDDWKDELDQSIIDSVYKELANTEFEPYLQTT